MKTELNLPYWHELLIEAVKPDGIFPPQQHINVLAPSAEEFFPVLNELDPDYFYCASDLLQVDGQKARILYCFQNFYVQDEDGIYTFPNIGAVEDFLRQGAIELAQEVQSMHELQDEIDSDLLTK